MEVERELQETRAVAETARHYLDVYAKWVHGYLPARHHQVWIRAIRNLVNGRSRKRKLLIITPPGHAKRTYLSLVFPPWYLGNHPDHSLLFFTSSGPMANQFDSTVRIALEQNTLHTLTFPKPECRPDYDRGWSSDGRYLQGTPPASKDPAYQAKGFGAASIGARVHGIILDDPLTQEQAQSEVEQHKAKAYHDLTVDSRLHPDGWELAIMNRWHELDLGGHLANKPDWDVIHMPAIADPPYSWGPALWPERFPLTWLEAKRADIGGPLFNCLYQGDPTSLGGSIFREAAWFKPFPPDFAQIRPRLSVVQFWDLAFSEKATADYTAAITVGIDRAGNVYVLHGLRTRADEDRLDGVLAEHILVTRPMAVGVEMGAFKQAATRDLIRRVVALLRGKYAVSVTPVQASKDKVFRARVPAARAEAGMLYADHAAPWWPELLAECIGFPLAAHDDYVDALAGAVQMAIETLVERPEALTFIRGGVTEGPKHSKFYLAIQAQKAAARDREYDEMERRMRGR